MAPQKQLEKFGVPHQPQQKAGQIQDRDNDKSHFSGHGTFPFSFHSFTAMPNTSLRRSAMMGDKIRMRRMRIETERMFFPIFFQKVFKADRSLSA
jgi:hypothetical protein